MNKTRQRIRVGITMGDPSGVGPSIIAKSLSKLASLAEFVVIGDSWVLNRVGYRTSHVPTSLPAGRQATSHGTHIKFVDLKNVRREGFKFGQVKAEYGRASMEYLDKAIDLITEGAIDCLVTCPISKEAINLAGFKYSGHTEYLAQQTKADNLVMMLLNKNLKCSLVTRHLALKDVPQAINKEMLYKNILISYQSLQRLFRIRQPHIVVCGLNPHASDNGVIGTEEMRVIAPVVKKIKNKLKARIDGPVSADAAIYKANQGLYDCVIAMYHDQAMIALKLFGIDSGVNLTLGLPFIRTSPLHGTAFDIAEDYRLINPYSFIAAIKIALKCASGLKRD